MKKTNIRRSTAASIEAVRDIQSIHEIRLRQLEKVAQRINDIEFRLKRAENDSDDAITHNEVFETIGICGLSIFTAAVFTEIVRMVWFHTTQLTGRIDVIAVVGIITGLTLMTVFVSSLDSRK